VTEDDDSCKVNEFDADDDCDKDAVLDGDVDESESSCFEVAEDAIVESAAVKEEDILGFEVDTGIATDDDPSVDTGTVEDAATDTEVDTDDDVSEFLVDETAEELAVDEEA